MRNYGKALTLAAASLGITALTEPGYGQRRPMTLDEAEERSVGRMMARARHRRRLSAKQKRIEEARAAEEARPKSRQELRAKARAEAKRGSYEAPRTRLGQVVGKDKSLALERVLGKRKRRDHSI